MRYAFLRDLVSQPYMIEPGHLDFYSRLFRGVLMGAVTETDTGANLFYCTTFALVSF